VEVSGLVLQQDRYYPDVYLERVTKTTKQLSQESLESHSNFEPRTFRA